ncbi:uncharacterized protein RAG0_13126 [Rhynchosporium agropyri]|uniref:2EXR domain-containing protein n=1 Tax=Rhynchosporium agropyri TaxID=914238 RepID=A0A1E1LB75_9HELO|nr:uncharacterized protein RAG0_13126 [Rhynchosporium agropyri]
MATVSGRNSPGSSNHSLMSDDLVHTLQPDSQVDKNTIKADCPEEDAPFALTDTTEVIEAELSFTPDPSLTPQMNMFDRRRLEALRARIDAAEKSFKGHSRSTFSFPQSVPAEIQHMIWKYAAFIPRVIEVLSDERFFSFRSRTLAPGMLHTCYDARKIGLKIYQEISQSGMAPSEIPFWKATYINYEVDTLFFESAKDFRRLVDRNYATDFMQNCRYLAIMANCARYLSVLKTREGNSGSFIQCRARKNQKLKNLKTIYHVYKYTKGISEAGNLTLTDVTDQEDPRNRFNSRKFPWLPPHKSAILKRDNRVLKA